MTKSLIEDLKRTHDEIVGAHFSGWGNVCLDAIAEIQRLQATIDAVNAKNSEPVGYALLQIINKERVIVRLTEDPSGWNASLVLPLYAASQLSPEMAELFSNPTDELLTNMYEAYIKHQSNATKGLSQCLDGMADVLLLLSNLLTSKPKG